MRVMNKVLYFELVNGGIITNYELSLIGNYIKAVELYREKHEASLTSALDEVIRIKNQLNGVSA